jgi:hypothetical protein
VVGSLAPGDHIPWYVKVIYSILSIKGSSIFKYGRQKQIGNGRSATGGNKKKSEV